MSNATPATPSTLAVVPLPGLHLDSLGLGMAALGLLSLCSRHWSLIRGGWRGNVFYLAGGPATEAELLDYIAGIGERGEWSSYENGWDAHQKSDTNAKSGRSTALWRAREADETVLSLFQSHIAPAMRLSFNPLFGTGGNAGARNFSDGWKRAVNATSLTSKFSTVLAEKVKKHVEQADKAIAGATKVGTKKHRDALKKQETAQQSKLSLLASRQHLSAFLNGGFCDINPSVSIPKPNKPSEKETVYFLADYGAACWFSSANKKYNYSPDKPYQEGQITPWAMALACEAFGLFQGSPSRRLGSARKAAGAFPFVTTGASPTAAGEAGKNLGEVWLPVWEQPMSLPEIIALFQRGRAEVNGKGATTPPAFAAAILQRGVDAGIREFRRFLLLRTTSDNTFESRLASVVPVAEKAEAATAVALTRMLGFRDSLPADRKKGKRWIYAGLRGILDESLVTLAEQNTPETAREAVDAMIGALRKADRNRGHRAHKPSIQFQLLPGAWAAKLLTDDSSDASLEARIGLALATLWAGKKTGKAKKVSAAPLLSYWLGVQQRGIFGSIPEAVPFRRVWGAGTLTANLAAVLQRRLIEEEPSAEPPFGSWYRVGLGDIEAWLSGALDDAEIERWMMRFSLFDWSKDSVTSVAKLLGRAEPPRMVSGSLMLFALFKPLFQSWLLSSLLPAESKREAAKVGPLNGIAAQLARGDVHAAVQLARNAYRAADIEPAKIQISGITCDEPQRLLAALLIPVDRRRLTPDPNDTRKSKTVPLCLRWLSPRKQTNNP